MRTLLFIVLALSLLTECAWAGVPATAHKRSYIVAVKQIRPDGESTVMMCDEGEACSLEVKLTAARIDSVKVDVLMTAGTGAAKFKFGTGKKWLYADHNAFLFLPLGDRPWFRTSEKVVLDYPMPGDGGLGQSLVLRASTNPVARLEITIRLP